LVESENEFQCLLYNLYIIQDYNQHISTKKNIEVMVFYGKHLLRSYYSNEWPTYRTFTFQVCD